MKKIIVAFLSFFFQLYGIVEDSMLPVIEAIYSPYSEVIGKSNLQAWKHYAMQNQEKKIRIMTYNMLYNIKSAEDKLPLKHRWFYRKPRLLEYLTYAKADIIASQELQEDQLQELMTFLGEKYSYYGLKTRQNEGRTDTNAIFYKTSRFTLIDAKTIPYKEKGGNAFTYCYFKDNLLDKNFIVINTKFSWGFSWGAIKKRFSEATTVNHFTTLLPATIPIFLMGDFNVLPCLDEKSTLKALMGNNLKDAESQSIFGHFGPFCSITNSSFIFTPFTGPSLKGYILDRIFVNDLVWILTCAIDTAKVNGEFPSDHFPVIVDLFFK